MTAKLPTHVGEVVDNKTKKRSKVLLRMTKNCWVSSAGKRFLKETGEAPGIRNFGNDLVRLTLDLQSVRVL